MTYLYLYAQLVILPRLQNKECSKIGELAECSMMKEVGDDHLELVINTQRLYR